MIERDFQCTECESQLEWHSGPAHPSNRYCPICDRPRQTRERLEQLQARADRAEQEKRELVRGLQAIADYGSDERGLHIDDFEAKYPEFIDMEQDEIARALLAKHEATP